MIESQADMNALGHLVFAMLRVLMAKGIVEKDDIMADLLRQQAPAEIAFAIDKILENMPKK